MTLLEGLFAVFLILAIVYMAVTLARSGAPAALGTPGTVILTVVLVLVALWLLRVPLGLSR